MNFVEFVEKYQQDMTPEQMLNIITNNIKIMK